MQSSRGGVEPSIIHATCVSYRGHGLLLIGPSGSGKSDLGLRLLDRAGWKLVADDRTELTPEGDGLIARSPATIQHLIEVRGVGIVTIDADEFEECSKVVAAIDLSREQSEVERLPESNHREMLGIFVPLLTLWPFEASTPLKVERWITGLIAGQLDGDVGAEMSEGRTR